MPRARGSDRRFIHLHRDPCQLLLHFGIAMHRTWRHECHEAGILAFLGIRQLSVFDTGLGSEIPIDKIGGWRPSESVRRLVVAPPVRYACDAG